MHDSNFRNMAMRPTGPRAEARWPEDERSEAIGFARKLVQGDAALHHDQRDEYQRAPLTDDECVLAERIIRLAEMTFRANGATGPWWWARMYQAVADASVEMFSATTTP